ncbi:hypothetical protein DVH05_024082 [Phytophthora capsici]|nr:hypothetical protein DVH05_024082 [Phytophthora capsici]
MQRLSHRRVFCWRPCSQLRALIPRAGCKYRELEDVQQAYPILLPFTLRVLWLTKASSEVSSSGSVFSLASPPPRPVWQLLRLQLGLASSAANLELALLAPTASPLDSL